MAKPKVLSDIEGKAPITHTSEVVNSETGAHNLRWFGDELRFYNGTDWVEIQTGGGGTNLFEYNFVGGM